MPQLDFSLLGPPVDFGARVREGMELGRAMVKRHRTRNALGRTTTLRNSKPVAGQSRSRRGKGGEAGAARGPAGNAIPEGTIIRKPGTNERMKRINGQWVPI